MNITYIELLNLSANSYLCEPLPDNFLDWSYEVQNEFIEDNTWEPFENWEPADLWKQIECDAFVLKRFLESKNITIIEE